MAADVREVLGEADRILQPERFEDYCVNGLQVPGAERVQRLGTAVSAHVELFERAVAAGVGLLVVHHGMFWGPGFRRVDAPLKRRLQLLFDADLALAAYHLPLDAHPELGNNALIARALGAEPLGRFAAHRGEPIGLLAAMPGEGIEPAALAAEVGELTSRPPLHFAFGPSRIRTLAVISGAGADYIEEAAGAGADALLTGEAPERAMAQARESGLHLLLAGHYATETFGVRALGQRLAERFGLEHIFIDVPNPL